MNPVEKVDSAYHFDHLGVYILRNHTPLGRDVFQHLVQCLSLDLLSLQFGIGVVEVEDNSALVKLFDKKLGALGNRGF